MSSFISSSGLTYLWNKIKAWVNGQGFLTQHQDISGKADKSTTTTAGTYKSVTVNSSGIVTGGSNPTTLAEYGITDAASSSDLSEYLPLSGGTMTGDITFNAVNKGIYLTDSSGNTYAAIINNTGNLWIGARAASDIHHTGGTYISAGNDKLYVSKLVNNSRATYAILDANNSYVASGKGYIYGNEITTITGNAATATTATTASKLSTVSKTVWGQTYWTSEGVPTDISGDMTSVGSVTPSVNGNALGTSSARFNIYGTAGNFSGNVSVGGTLGVTGAATLSSTLAVTGASTLGGYVYMPNQNRIYFKSSGNTDMIAVHQTSANHLYIGLGFASEGYSTYLAGNTVELRYGTSRTTGLTLGSDGIVSISKGLTIGGNPVAIVYSGSTAPSSSTGSDGDIYIQTS